MTGLPFLTLKDLEESGAAATGQTLKASKAAQNLPFLTLKDIVPETAKKEIPFAEGTNLEIPHPLGSVKLKLSGPEARLFAGAGKRLTGIGQRARQLVGDKTAQQEIDEAAVRDQPLMETGMGQAGHMLPDIIAGLQPTNIPNTLRAAGMQGLASGAVTPTTTAEQQGNAAILNPIVQSLGAMAGQKVLGGAANLAGKASNVAPAALASLGNAVLRASGKGTRLPVPEVPYTSAEARALQNLLTKQGVRSSIGDLDPNSGWRGFEDAMEGVMPSRREFMQGQQADLKDMLTRTQGAITKPVRDASGKVVPDSYAMAQGIKDAYTANKAAAKAKFEAVDQLATLPGVLPIKPNSTLATAQSLIREKPEYFSEMQDNPLWSKLLGVKRDTDLQQSVILQQTGKPFMKPQELDFSEVKALRSALGSEYRDAEKPSRKRAYAMLLKSIDDDLDTWGQGTGNKQLNAAYEDARSFYKQNVVPYTDPLANPSKSPLFSNIALKDKIDSETVPRGIFKEDRQQLAQDFVDLATPAGQQAAKNELVNEVVSAGLSPTTETGLSTSIIRHGDKYKAPGAAVFSPAEQESLSNAISALGTTRRAAGMSTTPPKTGMRIAPYAAGSMMMGSGVPAYYALNAAYGEELSPTQRVLLSFGALPLAGALGAKLGGKYTQSELGKMLHFAEPQAQSQGLGALQMLMRSGGRGAGSGAARGIQQQGLSWPSIMRDTQPVESNEFNY